VFRDYPHFSNPMDDNQWADNTNNGTSRRSVTSRLFDYCVYWVKAIP